MQITKVVISKGKLSFGEPFDLAVTIKTSATEELKASRGDELMFSLCLEDDVVVSSYIWDLRPVIYKSDGEQFGWFAATIGKSTTKTYTLKGLVLADDAAGDGGATLPISTYLVDHGEAREYALRVSVGTYSPSGWISDTAYRRSSTTLLLSRQAPTIGSVTVTDTREITNPLTGATGNPLDVFGRLVDGQSMPHVVVEHALDPLDPSLTAEVTLEVYGYMPPIIIMGQVVEPERYELRETLTSATGVFDLGAILLQTAELALRCRVTDSAGSVSSTAEWRQPIYVYSGPTLEDFAALRYKESLDSGSVQYVQAVDGPYLMVNLRAGADSVNGLNACRLQIGYREYGTDNWTMADVLTGADGMAAQYTEDRTIFGLHVFSPATTYEVVAVLTDCFGSTRLLSDLVLKAAAIFNIEKTGVAVGMRSTGTVANPLFQCAYPAVFRGDVTVPVEGLLKAVPVTVTSAQSVSASSTANYTAAVGAGDDWTPIGVVGYNYNSRYMTLLRAYINSDGEAACTIYNADSTARSVTIVMYVLCLRTG